MTKEVMDFQKTCLTCGTKWAAPVLDCPHCGGTSWNGPDFNTESNLHADTVAERFDALSRAEPKAGQTNADPQGVHDHIANAGKKVPRP